jgi:hypothetical protein
MRNTVPSPYMEIGHTIRTFPENTFLSCDGGYHHIETLPYASLGYGIKGQFFQELVDTFNLHRLCGIKQLAFLRHPVLGIQTSPTHKHFPHTRYTHSLDVGVLMGIFLEILSVQKMKEGRRDQMYFFDFSKTAMVAGFLHDILTPAGGDTMKTIDPMGFDEDTHFNEIFTELQCKNFFEKHNIDTNLLYGTVLNKGLLGKFLNIADKIAYVSRDVFYYTGGHTKHDHSAIQDEGFQAINQLITEQKYITSLWRNITLIKGEPCFKGFQVVQKVGAFMQLRARMFKHMYYHEQAQFPERALAWFVMNEMYNTTITRSDLLSMQDRELEKHIDDYTDIPFFASRCLQEVLPQVKMFTSKEDAQCFITELKSTGTFVSFYEKFESRTKNGIKDFFIFHKNKIGTLYDFDKSTAFDIEKTMNFPEMHRVYFFNTNELPMGYREKIIQLQK